jgi:formate--tetrahydrofolate ligase
LERHINNIVNRFKLPCTVAVNRFSGDTGAELRAVEYACRNAGASAELAEVWARGGEGGRALAEETVRLCAAERPPYEWAYELTDSIEDKIGAVVTKIYGGARAVFSEKAAAEIKRIESMGGEYARLPVIIAKTQYSLSHDPKRLGRPEGFDFPVNDVCLRAGAGFIVAAAGSVMLMPGLPKVPASENMTIEPAGNGKYTIKGLF